MARRRRFALKALGVALLGLWAANTSLFLATDVTNTRILAHRGVHQTYIGPAPGRDTCTASPIAEPKHGFIENTLPSMEAAFKAGAHVVEIDIHLTRDGQFAVFHDWTLGCRTNGSGQTNQTTLAELKALDAGWGYQTEDGRRPFRGAGVGLIPTLAEVLDTFPEGQFLINFKSNDPLEGTELASLLVDRGQSGQVFGVYGGPRPVGRFKANVPDVQVFTFDSVRRCLLRYAAIGWAGYVPGPCHTTHIVVPLSHAWLLWGWPHRFTDRMARAGTDVILVGRHRGGHTAGIDTPMDVARVPLGFNGFVWTNDLPAIAARPP